jgi:serine/threonine-protein kinase
VPIGTGTKLGQYEVQDFIGQGAMGLVYRAYHVQLERTGAVKVLQGIAPDPDTTARFRHEAQAIAQMRHPNIVNVYDFGEHDGVPYMIIEFVPGGSLANRLSQGPLDTATTLKYLRGIAAGLDHAHGLGIVHRDVKPANVLLEKDDTPVLADFGLAKLLQGSSLKSMTGVTTGTPAYMAPEQVTGSKVGPAADRYALASIAYEMLTGEIPFAGEGLMELLYAQVHREPAPPSTRNSALGPRVDAVIMRGLAKDPAARWESCAALVDALAAAMTNRPEPAVARTMAMSPGVASTMSLAAAAPAMAAATYVDTESSGETAAVAYPSPPLSAVKRKSRRGLVALAAAVVLLLLLVAGTIGYVAMHPQAPTFNLSPSTVVAGDTVVVTAKHLPANQNGEIRLHSPVVTFPFHADQSGSVSGEILIPFDSAAGDHLVEICWASACHASATLQVLAPVAVTPSAANSPSPTTGASPGATATPGQSPSPTARATATPTPAPSVTVEKISQTNGFSFVLHYAGGGAWSIYVYDVTLGRNYFAGTASVPSGNTFYPQTFKTPTGVVATNKAYVTACSNGSGRCYVSSTVTVTLT